MNRYLQDRAMRRMRNNDRTYMDMNMEMDGRNPYGSRGGYVSSRRGRRDRGYDYGDYSPEYYNRDYNSNNSNYRGQDGHYDYERYGQYNQPMEMYGYAVGTMRPYDMNMNYGRNNYRYDRGMDFGNEEHEYKEKLHKWIEKLKKKDRFNWSKEQVIQQAKNMGVKFDKYNEDEFYATYLMRISDDPQMANDPHMYLVSAKNFLEDDDVELKGSDKLCAYLYTIVLGEED